jgi:hypothetical protein
LQSRPLQDLQDFKPTYINVKDSWSRGVFSFVVAANPKPLIYTGEYIKSKNRRQLIEVEVDPALASPLPGRLCFAP